MKILLLLCICCIVYAQEYTEKPIVSLDGISRNFDFYKDWNYEINGDEIYICFENLHDENYSILIKRIEPLDSFYVTLTFDSIPKQNPSISMGTGGAYRIVWQQQVEGYWQLFSKLYDKDIEYPVVQLTNSQYDNITPQLSWNYLIWISDQNLMYANIDDSLSNIIKIDSINCSNPDFNENYMCIIYQNNITDGITQIKKASYNPYSPIIWTTKILIDEGYSINPKFSNGMDEYFTFQKKDTVWKAYLADGYTGFNDTVYTLWSSKNKAYNVGKPHYFSYPIPITKKNKIQDWFVVYESDSLNNKEIIIEFVPDNGQKNKNISNLLGDDIKPYALQINDSIAIFWEHWTADKSQIYCYKEKFIVYDITYKKSNQGINTCILNQNYPNPFNPKTIISYTIKAIHESPLQNVQLSIYNVIGQKINTLVNQRQAAGSYSIEWDGSKVPSGVYYYRLSTDNGFSQIRKMMVVK